MARPKRTKPQPFAKKGEAPAAKKAKGAIKKKKKAKTAATAIIVEDKGIVVAGSEAGAFYEVDSIIGKRKRGKGYEYLVRWKGCGPGDDTWEPASNMCDTAWEEAAAFEEKQAALEDAAADIDTVIATAIANPPLRPSNEHPRKKRTSRKSILLAHSGEEEKAETQMSIDFKKILKKNARKEVLKADTAAAATNVSAAAATDDDATEVEASPFKSVGESKEEVLTVSTDSDVKPAAKEGAKDEGAKAAVVVVKAAFVSSPAAEVTAVVLQESSATAAVVLTEVEAEKHTSAKKEKA